MKTATQSLNHSVRPTTPLVLITGCSGLVGSHIAALYIQRGYRVRGLYRPVNPPVSLTTTTIADPIEWVEGDILDIPSLEKALESVAFVIHAAAVVSFSPKDKTQMQTVNVEGTANVVNACLKMGIQKLCHISSVAALGRSAMAIAEAKEIPPGKHSHEIVVNEEAKWEDSPYNSPYAQSKYLAELEVWRGIAEGLNAVIVNPSLILGVGDWNRSSSRLFQYVWKEKPFYTEGVANYVDVRDVAKIIFLLMNADISSKRYILSAGNISYQDLFNGIADCFHKRRPRIRVSAFAAKLLWRLEWLRSQLTRKAPLITRETAQLAALSFRYDNSAIKLDHHVDFRSIEDTLQWCCKNYQKQLAMNPSVPARIMGNLLTDD
ncbi:MAG: NAD-dependent epimerase/dehydratase family protein [Bacteroidota bacterium]